MNAYNLLKQSSLIASLALLAGCGGAPGEGGGIETEEKVHHTYLEETSPSTGTETQAPAARIAFAGDKSESPAGDVAFDIEAVHAVAVAVDWKIPEQSATQTIEFYDPNGNLWQNSDKQFQVGANCTPLGDGYCRTWSSLQVRGSTIQDYGMAGHWTAKVYLNGAGEQLAEGSFELEFVPAGL
jgi:hypothetical protein